MGIKAAVAGCALSLLVAAPMHAAPIHADDGAEQAGVLQADSDGDTDGDDTAPKRDKGKAKPAPEKPQKPGDCVDVTTRARFTVGYDQIVILTSHCKKRMRCTVKTNVNPQPAIVELDPGEQKSVVTWRGSPARVFTPDVTCE